MVDINLANGSCNLPYKSLPIDEINTDIRYQDNILFTFPVYTSFMNCSRTMSDPDYIRVPCFSGNASHIYAKFNSYMMSDLGESCEFTSMVPAKWPAHVEHPSYGDLLKVLASGFDLSWSIEGRNCRLSGGRCQYTGFDAPSACSCERKPSIFFLVLDVD